MDRIDSAITNQHDLAVLIVNWNTGTLLHACVLSVFASLQTIDCQVIVVDNDSSDDSMAPLRELARHEPRLHLIETGRNLGFAAGNNLAIAHASSRYLVLLNPDTHVKPGVLDAAVRFLDDHPACGAFGPKLLNSDGSLQPSVGNFPTVAGMFWELTRLRTLFPSVSLFSSFKRQDIDYNQPQRVEQPSGACLFLRRTAIDQAGLLDQRFYMYYEEVDLCLRIHRAGWEIHYLPTLEVVHYGGQSSARNLDVRIVENARSKLRFFAKHGADRPLVLPAVRAMVSIEAALKYLRALLQYRQGGEAAVQAAAAMQRQLVVLRMAIATPAADLRNGPQISLQ